MRLALDLPVEDLAEAFAFEMRQDDLLDLICETDTKIGEVEFTEELIQRLCRSIRSDMAEADFSAFLAELGKVQP